MMLINDDVKFSCIYLHQKAETLSVCMQYGDYDEATYQPEMLATEDMLPQRVIDQYQMTPEMWADKIKLWYTDFQGMQRYSAPLTLI